MSEKIVVVTGPQITPNSRTKNHWARYDSIINHPSYSKTLSNKNYGNNLPELWQFARKLSEKPEQFEQTYEILADTGWDVITENIHSGHHVFNTTNLISLYGSLYVSKCLRCHKESQLTHDEYISVAPSTIPECVHCGKNRTRPNIVLPGEPLHHKRDAEKLIKESTTTVFIGVDDEELISRWAYMTPRSILVSENPWGGFTRKYEMNVHEWVQQGLPL